jgi:hypothetical protein
MIAIDVRQETSTPPSYSFSLLSRQRNCGPQEAAEFLAVVLRFQLLCGCKFNPPFRLYDGGLQVVITMMPQNGESAIAVMGRAHEVFDKAYAVTSEQLSNLGCSKE